MGCCVNAQANNKSWQLDKDTHNIGNEKNNNNLQKN